MDGLLQGWQSVTIRTRCVFDVDAYQDVSLIDTPYQIVSLIEMLVKMRL